MDVGFGDYDTDTYKYETMYKLLYRWEKENKDKNCNKCHEKRKYISLCVFSVYGILGKESLVLL